MAKYEPGDEVVIIDREDSLYGKTFTLVEIDVLWEMLRSEGSPLWKLSGNTIFREEEGFILKELWDSPLMKALR